jgi:hypothetical protein
MNVYLNKITGIEDAIISMYLSKRTWTKELNDRIISVCEDNLTLDGFLVRHPSKEMLDYLKMILKYGYEHKHTTLLRFIDLSFVVENIHRAGQDDWDSHAKRMDNRIVRASTRLATFSDGEKSDYYKDKILYPFEMLDILGIELPNNVFVGKDMYVKTDFGYIIDSLQKDKDAKRGLYPEAIPSTFIFKVQYPELCHIIQHRDINSTANEEVKQLAEKIKLLVARALNQEFADVLTKLKME